jgi:GNAT superfamily N-acetyltransferase
VRYQLRPATDSDRDFLWELLVATMKEYVDQTWGWDAEDQRRRFREHFPPSRYGILVVEDQDAGALAVERGPAELFLASILILPEHQGQGLGTAVIQDLVREAEPLGLPVTLRVLKVNPAIRLYRRLGFHPVEETPTHFVMRKD